MVREGEAWFDASMLGFEHDGSEQDGAIA